MGLGCLYKLFSLKSRSHTRPAVELRKTKHLPFSPLSVFGTDLYNNFEKTASED